MIMEKLIILFSAIITYIIVHIIHELGHFIPSFIFDLEPRFIYSKFYIPCAVRHFDDNNIFKMIFISISGIFLGFIPIFFFLYIFYYHILGIIFFIFMFVVYLFACNSDFCNIKNDIKTINFINT